MELTFTVTGANYEQIREKSIHCAAEFYKKYESSWVLSIGQITPSSEKHQGDNIISTEWEAEVVATPWDGFLMENDRNRPLYQYKHIK